MATAVLLYTRVECELCDRALVQFQQLCVAQPELEKTYEIRKVDISTDSGLEQKFGLSIPVLEREDNQERLYWPFPPSRLRDFLSR